MLDCSQAALAEEAKIARYTLGQIEKGKKSTDRIRQKIMAALKGRGIEFLVDTERGRYGVILHVKDDVLPG